MHPQYTPKQIERFWSHVDTSGDCWVWRGGYFPFGYGCFKINGRRTVAHRAAWEVTNGSIPAGKLICHRCDNPPCVRPDHLFLGTYGDNVADCVAKDRRSKIVGDEHWSHINAHRIARGQAHGLARLTDDAVRYIRSQGRTMTLKALAAKFSVAEVTIHRVKLGETWRHVQDSLPDNGLDRAE